MEPTAEVVPPSEIPGSALNDGCPPHPEKPAEVPDEKPKKRKKEVPEWQRPEALAEYDAATLKLINDLDGEIDSLFDDALSKKAAAKEAKDDWEAKRDEMQRVIKERKNNRGKPVQKTLFEAAAPVADEPTPVPTVEAVPLAGPDPLEDLWKEFPIDRCTTFGLTARDVDILASGERKGGLPTYPVRTIGESALYSSGDGSVPRHFADFKGLGASGSDRIGAALEAFWGGWGKGGKEEFAKEKGLTSGNPTAQPDAGGGGEDPRGGDLGGGVQPEGAGGTTGDDGEPVGYTTPAGETEEVHGHTGRFENGEFKPDGGVIVEDEDLAAIPTGNDADTFSLGGGE